jgi:DNA-binding CsgD family transcriptional regulator
MAWTREKPGDDRFPRIAGAMWQLWFNFGSLQEGSEWLDDAVARSDGLDAEYAVRLLAGAGWVAMAQCAFAKSAALLERTRPLATSLANRRWLGMVEFGLGVIEQDEGRPDRARERFEAALAAFREADEGEFGSGIAISNLGLVTARLGDYETGKRLLSEGLSMHRETGYKFGTALSLRFLGQVCRDAGDLEEAERCFEASLKIDVTRTQQWHVASSLEGLADVAAKRRHAARAARLLGAASQVREGIGVPLEPALITRYERLTKSVRDALGETTFTENWAVGRGSLVADLIAVNGANGFDHAGLGPRDQEESVLSAREVQILQLVADGKSSREIADAAFISPRTVTTHISNIFAKLDVHDRGAAIAQAYQRGILKSSGADSAGEI